MDGNSENSWGIPPAVARAWGVGHDVTTAPRRGLSLERIVRAGIDCAAAEGIGAVSMSRVAAMLGVSAMALYRYVGAKDELLLLMEDAAVGPPPPELAEPADWRTGLAEWARAYRRVLHDNLWVLAVPVSSPPATPNSVVWMEYGLRALRGSGLDAGERLGVLTLLSEYVRGEAAVAADLAAAAREAGLSPAHMNAAYGRLLAGLADRERFPEVNAVLDAGVLEAGGDGGTPSEAGEDFDFGLERVLDGVAALVDRGRADA
ncbi:TetR/AcrR family transcriptional regulator [Streptomyces durbertensis]|uniref:TetR/AcrR family transcriptional regulator n=1 Tax=Streptomyces durbertensis TaxID=2448886 RepID=A0ABR6EDJ9_9ACTN|nr:TetR/AcrR family transcriptional regulator [Streptomyces durbertensis]MBB1243401.1 TetR/AcrR family transcriptional regulator [Streptomyces durbertensis]